MVIKKNATLDRTFHALADGTRRSMLAMLASGEAHTAGALGKPFAISQPAASKHLKVLEQAGLITRKRQGRQVAFTLNPAELDAAQSWIHRHTAFWKGSLAQLGSLIEEKSAP